MIWRRRKQAEPVPASVDWHYDTYLRQRAIAETWRKFAGGGLVLCGVLAATTVYFATHVERETLVVRVDNATGAVDLLPSNDPQELARDQKLAASQAWTFVASREQYNPHTWRHDYDQAGSMSSDSVRLAMYNEWESKEPGVSPLYTYGETGRITVDRISTSFDPRYPNVVWIRFTKTSTRGPETKTERLLATVVYRFVDTPRAGELSQFNPLGFQVVGYEVVPDNGDRGA